MAQALKGTEEERQKQIEAYEKQKKLKKQKAKPIVVECIVKKVVKNPNNPNYVMKCINCGQEFRSTRKTALYCSLFCSRQYRSKNL